jgi:ubiquinone/menaquinone biosynthesis C-methylase UbiE
MLHLSNQSLQELCNRAVWWENYRKWLIDQGQFKKAGASYHLQKTFLPDENTGEFWDQKFATELNFHFMEDWRLHVIASRLDLSKSVLNLGVGRGKLEEQLVRKAGGRSLQYLGTDITQSTLALLKKRFPQLRFSYERLEKLSLKNDSYDQVCLLEVLEHIKPNQTFAVLSEVYRVLVPGGKFLISVPVNEGLEEMLPTNPNSHMRMYSESLLHFELQSVGFKVKKTWRASAFQRMFLLKHMINKFTFLRAPNNIIIECSK